MNPERWRCFVAIPISDSVRAALVAAVETWRERPDLAGLRWTDPASWHVTVAFLGSIDVEAVDELTSRINEMAEAHRALRLRTGHLGGFPSAARARVAWYGIADPDRELRRLADDLHAALGVDADRFRGHMTLARARGEAIDLRAWLRQASAPEGELVVDRLDLMRSHLGRGPARYERLASAALEVPSRV